MVNDVAIVEGNNLDDPFQTSVTISDELLVPNNCGAIQIYH